ncbi:unnamed protein product [Orchesella dallaii]|uniref:Uncharacterized protein n=1 Tax=Orchesella dallaii TaxID=48710 RepID=A0ABP1QTT4_9HEXA
MEPMRGRGRGRGVRRLEVEADLDLEPQRETARHENSPQGVGPSLTVGRGRGRGRGIVVPEPAQLSFDPSPVTLPENPEEDDFLAAFRRLQLTGSMGRGRGRGFSFSSVPVPSTAEDSGIGSQVTAGRLMTPLQTQKNPTSSLLSARSSSGIAKPGDGDLGLKDLDFNKEPIIKRGQSGKRVSIAANFVRLKVAKEMGIFEYYVDFKPEVENFRFRKKLISSLTDKLGSAKTFDGSKLYLATKLPNDFSEFSVPYPQEPDQNVHIIIKFVKKNNLTECVHFYNVLFRRIMESLGMVEMKRNFYNHRAVFDVPLHKLEIWPGYVTAIDEFEGGLLLCCDSSHRVLRTTTVLDAWNDFISDNLERSKMNFMEYIVGKIVITNYNKRHYRIDGVEWSKSPKSTFTNSRQEEMTFVQYYEHAYKLCIKDMTQPLLVHHPKSDEKGCIPVILLVPELCNITGMDSSITSNYKIMKDIACHTRLTPQQRNLALKKLIDNVNNCDETKSILNQWGLTLEEAGVRLEGRVMTIPSIFLTKKQHEDPNHPGYFPESANFGNLRSSIFDPIPVRNWLLFFSGRDRARANRMMEVYKQVAQPFGIDYGSLTHGQPIDVGNASTESFRNALEKHIHDRVQFVVVILPSAQDNTYAMIKTICTTGRPIPSQVILSKNLGDEKKLRSIMQKIVLQINCKLGGSLWAMRIPLREKIMFIGFDVYHDPKRKSQSVTALVASLNNTHTKYYSRVIFQHQHQETVNSMFPILKEMLRAYDKENKGFPDRVIVWRDGVGDGQLMYTKDHEVPQIVSAFKSLNIGPKFTFCVVQKRINARLYLQEKHSLQNPEPGTIIDHTITRKYLYDFFLISQLVREGTVSPTHYVVLEDNSNISPDLIQKFAFATSFMYFNWTGSVRVPAMCQYAHKLALLVGQYTQCEPAREMATRLYYL